MIEEIEKIIKSHFKNTPIGLVFKRDLNEYDFYHDKITITIEFDFYYLGTIYESAFFLSVSHNLNLKYSTCSSFYNRSNNYFQSLTNTTKTEEEEISLLFNKEHILKSNHYLEGVFIDFKINNEIYDNETLMECIFKEDLSKRFFIQNKFKLSNEELDRLYFIIGNKYLSTKRSPDRNDIIKNIPIFNNSLNSESFEFLEFTYKI